ncbi:hypothetical protein [Nonomuraea dietziae]|uniref:hypothetical protein n=1 Tax=Nonomuraea dietziae TaxID=65515 RepID=UPI003CD0AE55
MTSRLSIFQECPSGSVALADLPSRVAAYRAGYLSEDRRAWRGRCAAAKLLGLATTNALELGASDVSGLDAVLIADGRHQASLWQQAGQGGPFGQGRPSTRTSSPATTPVDTYSSPSRERCSGVRWRRSCSTPTTPTSWARTIWRGRREIPLADDDLPLFGPSDAHALADDLVEQGMLRRRPTGYFWTRRERATDLADIRGSGGAPVQVVESATGRLLGTVDERPAHTHRPHRRRLLAPGRDLLVELLDLEAGVALVSASEPDYSTFARDVTEISVLSSIRSHQLGTACLTFGEVEVTRPGRLLPPSAASRPGRCSATSPSTCAPAHTCAPARGLVDAAGLGGGRLAEDGIDLGGASARRRARLHRPAPPVRHLRPAGNIGGVSTELHADTYRSADGSSSTTGTRAGRGSPSAATHAPRTGSPPPGRPSRRASASAAALRASSHTQVRQRQRRPSTRQAPFRLLDTSSTRYASPRTARPPPPAQRDPGPPGFRGFPVPPELHALDAYGLPGAEFRSPAPQGCRPQGPEPVTGPDPPRSPGTHAPRSQRPRGPGPY